MFALCYNQLMKMMTYFLPLFLLFLSSCASKPVLYPNEKYKSMGKESSNKVVEKCIEMADAFLESPKGKQILKGAGKGSVIGTVLGGITGLLTGDLLQSLATGAVAGAATGATSEAISPNRLKQAYVNRCLAKNGYEVIGWD